MPARRLISVLCVGLVASATVVAAQPGQSTPPTPPAPAGPPTQPGQPAPKTPPKTKRAKGARQPLAPAKDAGSAGSASTSASGSAAGGAGSAAGSAVQMTEDPPPDMNGTAENPDSPRVVTEPEAPTVVAIAPPPPRTGYPIEQALRPITLPLNMSEVSLAPHAVVLPYTSTTALRARYGITSKVQLGLTYVVGGIFRDPGMLDAGQAFHPGKTLGLDVTVLLRDWIGISAGVPVYINPLAVSLAIGVPIKFTFGDKYALGGLDDLLNIRLDRFAPTFYQESQNATNAETNMSNTIHSQGELRFSIFGIYQYQPDFAITLRTGIQMEDLSSGKTDGCNGECATTFIYAGFQYSPRRYLDLGLSIGFDDLAHGGSFAPAGYLAFRI